MHIVDDEPVLAEALSFLFASRGLSCHIYPCAEAFLADRPAPAEPVSECVLLDVRMAGMSGVQLHARLREEGCTVPVIFLTGHGDVPMAVQALKAGAFDFIEKPFSNNDLVDRVEAALAAHAVMQRQSADDMAVRERLTTLTPREREVMHAVAAGKLNKIIADELGVSMRTVEVHRSRVFDKMRVRGAVELARLLKQHGID